MEKVYDQLVKSTIDGKLYNVVNIGGIVKYFKNMAGLSRYLRRLGYRYKTMELENGEYEGYWEKIYKSEAEIWLTEKFK